MKAPEIELPRSAADRYRNAIDRMLERIDRTAAAIGAAFPLCADPETGNWETSPDGRWTGGFWAGLLFLAYRATGDAKYRKLALSAMQRLEPRLPVDNVLNGLVFYYGAAIGEIVCGEAAAAELAVKGATALAGRFNAATGFIPLGHQSGSLTADARGETNIDGVPGMSLLYWAARKTGSSALADIATRHVDRHIQLCQRPDGSLHQAALVDAGTGELQRQYSPRGCGPDGAWARAQSWGLVGFAQAHHWTRHAAFLEAAVRVADWWLASAPSDHVAFWDFRDPDIPRTHRDTSASAMTAAALLKLGRAMELPQPRRRHYLEAGTRIVLALLQAYLTPTGESDRRPRGILTEGCWQKREGVGTRHELIWGDYYLFESVLALAGRVEETF